MSNPYHISADSETDKTINPVRDVIFCSCLYVRVRAFVLFVVGEWTVLLFIWAKEYTA